MDAEQNVSIREACLKVLAACWESGNRVAGASPEARNAVATAAIKVLKSRKPLTGKLLAKKLIAALEPTPELVGPLFMDYEAVANAILNELQPPPHETENSPAEG